VGGVEDHVHLLSRLAHTITQADLIKEIKRVSGHWLKERSPDLSDFQWQGGYADFSVSYSNLEQVSRYIENRRNIIGKLPFKKSFAP
jgi:REP element-mobilizing transposase RayT